MVRRQRSGNTTDRTISLDFQPIGLRGEYQQGRSLLEYAREVGAGLLSICGGSGTCARCKVQLISGTASEPTSSERDALTDDELAAGFRLACQAYPDSDCTIRVPPESLSAPQRTQVESIEVAVRPEPSVRSYDVELDLPTLKDHEADAERLSSALGLDHGVNAGQFDLHVLRELPPEARSSKWRIAATVRGGEVIAVRSWGRQSLGLAVDLGTTKVAGYLLDLDTGKTLASHGIMNPQISYGEDVIGRITVAGSSPDEAVRLQELALGALGELVRHLCNVVSSRVADILDVVVVGNTAMHHLLLGLPVSQLALSPYVPVVRQALDIRARDIGLDVAPGACVHLLPNIAGFVGGDHVAMLLATKLYQAEGVVLSLDIGTNTEICLASNGVLTSVSCASGPAFEGAHIKHGMRGAKGAIEHVRITDSTVEIETIGDAPAVGLCGSGILDAVAQMYVNGVVATNGRMRTDHPRVREVEGEREFILVDEDGLGGREITITQKDIREVQLAKAAIRTGIQSLMADAGKSDDDIDAVVIAGAFGSYLDPASAAAIGMFPPLPINRFQQVGNAAGTGARLALASVEQRNAARNLAERVGYIELAATPDFTHLFAQANYLGRYRITDGKRQKRPLTDNA